MLVYGHDEQLAAWIGEQLGARFTPPYTCIGILRHDQLAAACLYNNFMPPDVQMTIASVTPRWATRQVIARLFGYPFLELGCARVSALTRVHNLPARDFLARLGFRQEGYHPSMFHDDDGVSYGLLRDDATHWLEVPHESHDIPDIAGPDASARGAAS